MDRTIAALVMVVAVVLLVRLRLDHAKREGFWLWFLFFMMFVHTAAVISVPLAPERGLHFGHARMILGGFLFLAIIPRIRLTPSRVWMIGFLTYLFVRSLFSTDYGSTAVIMLNLFSGMVTFLAAAALIDSEEKLLLLGRVYMGCGAVLLASVALFQWLSIGEPAYGIDGLRLAGGDRGIYTANLLAYVIIASPLFLWGRQLAGHAWRVIGLVAAATVIVVLIYRRSAVLAMMAGFTVHLLFGWARTRLLRNLAVGALLATAASPLYIEGLQRIVELRGDLSAATVTARRPDVDSMIDAFAGRDAGELLFGVELFNSSNYFGRNRQTHSDYANILLGAGLFGLIGFVGLHLVMALEVWLKSRRTRSSYDFDVVSLNFAFLAATVIISAANQLWVVSSLAFAFTMLGAINGVAHAKWRHAKSSGRFLSRTDVRVEPTDHRSRHWSGAGLG